MQFQRLSKKIHGYLEKCLVSQYIGGLKEEVRYEVLVANPISLPAAIQVAKLYEAKLMAMRRTCRSNAYTSKSQSSVIPAASMGQVQIKRNPGQGPEYKPQGSVNTHLPSY